MKEEHRNYLLVGIFVTAMLVGLMVWIGNVSGEFDSTDDYYIRFGSVLGLSEGTQVYFDGYPVGEVEKIVRKNDDDPQPFLLTVTIRKDWNIPEDSQAEITNTSLLSVTIINIKGGSSSTMVELEQQILSVEPVNLMEVMSKTAAGFSDFVVKVLEPKIESIVTDMSGVMDQVNSMLSPQNAQNIAEILENLESVSRNLDDFTAGLDDTQEGLDKLLAETTGLIEANEDELHQSIVDLHETLEALARHADAIAYNLEVTTHNMSEITQQVRENPGVLLRGRASGDDPAEKN